MAIWYRQKDLPEQYQRDYSERLERWQSPTGAMWMRIRGDQELADLNRIQREHHPCFDSDASVK